jgi:CheY-like chemotaxis protein
VSEAALAPPLSATTPPALATQALAPIPGRLRVLIADDNQDYADSLAEVLRQLGCEVRLAYDGRAAFEAARTWQPEVCLFDIDMPGLDGHTLAAAVRHLPGGQHLLLVAVTGQAQQHTRANGFDHHFVKPLAIERLAARFAAKEATRKALQGRGPTLTAIEIRTADDGSPSVWIAGERTGLACSLSHDAGVAMAVVIGDTTMLDDIQR